jgi:hypothetical protein
MKDTQEGGGGVRPLGLSSMRINGAGLFRRSGTGQSKFMQLAVQGAAADASYWMDNELNTAGTDSQALTDGYVSLKRLAEKNTLFRQFAFLALQDGRRRRS